MLSRGFLLSLLSPVGFGRVPISDLKISVLGGRLVLRLFITAHNHVAVITAIATMMMKVVVLTALTISLAFVGRPKLKFEKSLWVFLVASSRHGTVDDGKLS